MTKKCAVCGKSEVLTYPDRSGIPTRELIDGAPYVKGLVCHPCDDAERAKHATPVEVD
jgi:hypothetical protein